MKISATAGTAGCASLLYCQHSPPLHRKSSETRPSSHTLDRGLNADLILK